MPVKYSFNSSPMCVVVMLDFIEDDDGSSGETLGSGTGLVLEALLQRLPTCVNKDFIDEVIQPAFVFVK